MINILLDIAKKAGNKILEIYEQDFEINLKEDNSPLTTADKAANEIIAKELNKNFPNIPIISEEIKNQDYEARKEWGEFFLVDPLDGTKEFIKKNGEFTVNIAYCKNNKVKAGVVHIPVANVYYYSNGTNSYKKVKEDTFEIKCQPEHNPLRVVASKSHFSDETKNYIEKLNKKYELVSIGSSIKICLVAEGTADIYPRLGPTMEWDTAAAHAIIKTAGGNILGLNNKELEYNKEDLLNPYFIAKKN